MPAATRNRNRNARRRRSRMKDDPDLQKVRCQLCPYQAEDEADFESHKRTDRHRFNYYLFQFIKHRNRLVKDRHGAKVECKISSIKYKSGDTATAGSSPPLKYDPSDGTLKTVVSTEITHVVFDFIVSNTCKEEIYVRDAYLLHPYKVFKTTDEKGLVEGKAILRIHPDSSYIVRVIFENTGIGSYGVPLQFEISSSRAAPKDVKEHSNELGAFNLVRVLVINVRDNDSVPPDVIPQEPSPFRRQEWCDVEVTVEGTWPNGGPIKRMNEYSLPWDHYLMFYNWLGPWDNMTNEQREILYKFTIPIIEGYANLRKNYVSFMHDLLYLEEYDGIIGVQVYNMCGVCLEHVTHSGSSQFKLEVPGLGEKRPSLVKGDLAYVRIQLSEKEYDTTEYESVIAEVRESAVLLTGFAEEFLQRYLAEAQHTELRFAVRFAFNRYPLVVMHRAIDYCERDGLLDTVVFPHAPKKKLQTFLNGKLGSIRFYNRQLVDNPAQKQAVISILQGTSRPAPYIIYGPPGTGKTATLVEAILQVKTMMPGSYCLVVAPSNSACDNVAQRLAVHCSPKELLRLHSSTRDWDTVPADIYDYSNRTEGMFFFPSREDLFKFRIVVMTLVFCGRLVERCAGDDTHRHFTHVFVDECGQAKEPETLVALGGVVGPVSNTRLGGQVVLAGDPQQLGPVCTSRRAECLYGAVGERDDVPEDSLDRHIGLGVSMLERLMKTCELYREPYNPLYITQLVYNYRSHPDILHLPNILFYGGNLQERCPDSVRNDAVLSLSLNGAKGKGCAVVFDGVLGKEEREGQSPSHFNRYEVAKVLKYIDKLTGPKANVKLKQTEIGIIAPYIRQVYKIKVELKKRQLLDIEVGTTETFQGREKRVIIMSTVRSNPNLLDYDHKYQLGFLVNPKRFNVAITRAQSLLIVIGNPILLSKDDQWRQLVEYTRALDSYCGCPYQPRNTSWTSSVTQGLQKLHMDV